MTASSSALVIFAHGARDAEWAKPFHVIRDAISARAPGVRVELAFLELMSPTLTEAIDALATQGMREIVIVPAFMAEAGHVKRDVPKLIDDIRARHPGCRIRMTRAIGEVPEVVAAIAGFARAELGL